MELFLLIIVVVFQIAIFVRIGQLIKLNTPDRFEWNGWVKPQVVDTPMKDVLKTNIMPNDPKPKKRGAIYMPKTDLEEAREKKIAENMSQGKDTMLSELE